MNTSDSLPTPLDQKPATKLKELGRKPAGEGFETITCQGDDGYKYEARVKTASLPFNGDGFQNKINEE